VLLDLAAGSLDLLPPPFPFLLPPPSPSLLLSLPPSACPHPRFFHRRQIRSRPPPIFSAAAKERGKVEAEQEREVAAGEAPPPSPPLSSSTGTRGVGIGVQERSERRRGGRTRGEACGGEVEWWRRRGWEEATVAGTVMSGGERTPGNAVGGGVIFILQILLRQLLEGKPCHSFCILKMQIGMKHLLETV
jgi:hypothetical protein